MRLDGALLYLLQLSGITKAYGPNKSKINEAMCDVNCKLNRLLLSSPKDVINGNPNLIKDALKKLCIREIIRKVKDDRSIKINVGHQGISNHNNLTNVINIPKSPELPPVTIVIINNINQTFKGIPPQVVETESKAYRFSNANIVHTQLKNLDMPPLNKEQMNTNRNKNDKEPGQPIDKPDEKMLSSRTKRALASSTGNLRHLVEECVNGKLKDLN